MCDPTKFYLAGCTVNWFWILEANVSLYITTWRTVLNNIANMKRTQWVTIVDICSPINNHKNILEPVFIPLAVSTSRALMDAHIWLRVIHRGLVNTLRRIKFCVKVQQMGLWLPIGSWVTVSSLFRLRSSDLFPTKETRFMGSGIYFLEKNTPRAELLMLSTIFGNLIKNFPIEKQ